MSIDFFSASCQEATITSTKFGICDDQDGAKAYTDQANSTNWVATVINNNAKPVTFTAIDNCIIIYKKDTNDKESSCDGMITFDNSLYLIELKNVREGWIAKAIDQLENTIKLIQARHDISAIRNKKVVACNKKHPHFTVLDPARKKQFFDKYQFRLDVQAHIVIK